jgi:hypothetical protein
MVAVLMVGAIGAHLGPLGIEVQGDSSLFIMGILACLAGAVVAWVDRKSVPFLCKT